MSFWSAGILRLWKLSNHLWSKLKPDDLRFDGGAGHFLHLGTVMTKKAFRHQGYIRAIMEQIDAELLILTYTYDFPVSARHMPHNRAACAMRKGKTNC